MTARDENRLARLLSGRYNRAALLPGSAVALVCAILVLNAVRFTPHSPAPVDRVAVQIDLDGAAARLADALTYPTISRQGDSKAEDSTAFSALHTHLRRSFPTVHAALEHQTVNDLSLLYRWQGHQADAKAVLLMAHQDVVPPVADSSWAHGPFDGEMSNGYIWGRGALDDKGSMMGILEAVEMLLMRGFVPARTVYLAFGHDEEVGGLGGAAVIAGELHRRNVHLAFVLDEGGVVTERLIPGVDKPVALIGVAEKGYLSVRLSATAAGGHTSMPPPQTSVGRVARAVNRLERHPFPASITTATEALLDVIGREMTLPRRVALANLWLLRSFVVETLAKDVEMNAALRTTTAVTMFSGGVKENVLPTEASAIVNFRILPGHTTEEVMREVTRIVADDAISIRQEGAAAEPSPVSSSDTPAYRLIGNSLREVSPEEEILVAPYVVIGTTDARHFTEIADDVYRFVGFKVGPEGASGVHGVNERIAVAEYARLIRTYRQIIVNLDRL